ncbi:bacteriorhodopsin [Naasia sp. SYSU D00948]|uniref:bacteriorhodopsin n=1 Tax=Naasia sp. SYSU D00948 TaxID=2817379 RepID=UPI001B315B4D|nr:bacteriorhodopsin [Naasia sp. SYSU D00948]
MTPTAVAPWTVPLHETQYSLIYYFLVVAGLALLAHLLRTLTSREEIGPRFRPAVIASLVLTAVAFLSYVSLVLAFELGYDRTADGYTPNEGAFSSFAPRYMDWTVTVPLLCVELLAVTALAGAAVRRARAIAMASAVLMISLGYLGGVVVGGGESVPALLVSGGISTVFFVVICVVLVRAVRASLPVLSREAGRALVLAIGLLLGSWLVYPLAYLVQVIGSGGAVPTTMHIAFCVADVVAKVAFGEAIHKVAKVRTADDVNHGEDVHPESTWISSVKRAPASLPPVAGAETTAEEHLPAS